MKRIHAVLLSIGLIFILAVMTNPNQDRHKEVAKAKFNAYIQKSMSGGLSDSDNEWEQAGQALGMLLGGALIEGIVANAVTSDNYLIFSTTKITWGGESRVVGVGAFGNVFLSKQIDETLNEELLSP